MTGPGYNLPNVPWVMYFAGANAIHGAYWHNNFGRPMSHGCVNMRISEAQWLYNWASIGTPVVVHY
jgi:lipoprotein-anchoring transpeptidase ErfK/SrfK